jgi:hypothetical protein
VTASGVVAVLGSVLTLLGLSIGLLGLLIVPMPPNAQVPPGIRAMSLSMLFIFMACAVFGIVAGVGLLRLKNWRVFLRWSGVELQFSSRDLPCCSL